jgi:hypothetical protein
VKEIKEAENEAIIRLSNVLIFKITRHLKVLNLLGFLSCFYTAESIPFLKVLNLLGFLDFRRAGGTTNHFKVLDRPRVGDYQI